MALYEVLGELQEFSNMTEEVAEVLNKELKLVDEVLVILE